MARKSQSLEVFLASFRSPDRPTRKMSYFFVLSVMAVMALGAITVKRITQDAARKRHQMNAYDADQKKFTEFVQKQANDAKRRATTVSLGNFNIELKPDPTLADDRAALHLAEIVIVVQCDSKETSTLIEERLAQISNELTNVFVPMERDELLSSEGKRRLKQTIIQKLNKWLPNGKVEQVYFPKLLIS